MTILNNVLLSLAIAPLALSIAFAQGGDDPVEGIDIIITEAGFANTNVKQPIVAQERKMMMRKTIKPLAQVNPARAMLEEKETYHNEKKSECWLLAQRNIACAERHDADE